MKQSFFKGALAAFMLAAAFTGHTADADHLIMTKVCFDGPNLEDFAGSGEFVEIYNPTNSSVALKNYFIADANTVSGSQRYFDLPSKGADGKLTIANADYLWQFPDGYSIGPKKTVVVTQSARIFLSDYFAPIGNTDDLSGKLNQFYNQINSPLLFEISDENNAYLPAEHIPGVPKMVRRFNNTTAPTATPEKDNRNYTLNMSNAGEFVALFHWDGVSSIIQDADVIGWGAPGTGADSVPTKTGLYTYKADNGSGVSGGNLIFTAATTGAVFRKNFTETSEVSTNGNGITGHDESTEDVKTSWGQLTHLQLRTSNPPGVVKNVPSSVQVTDAERNIKYPTPTDSLFLNAVVQDPANASSAKFHVTVDYPVASGTHSFDMVFASPSSSFTAATANIGSYPEGTYIRWYAETKDQFGVANRFPIDGEKVFVVTNKPPIAPGEIVINELMYDPSGTDNSTNAEWIELYNTTNAEIDISYVAWANSTNTNRFSIPAGTKIPANGYLIITANKPLFESRYSHLSLNTNAIVSYQAVAFDASVLANPGSTLAFANVNDNMWENVTTPSSYIDYIVYEAGSNPTSNPPIVSTWPGTLPASGSSPYNPTNPNSGGPSIELKNPTWDNNVGSNWAVSTAPIVWSDAPTNTTQPRGGTPLSQNTAYTSSIDTWTLY